MNENYENNNYETIEETTVEFEPMVVDEVAPQHDRMMIGVGIGAVAAIAIEHAVIPAVKWTYHKVKGLKKPKFHVIENVDVDGVDESDIED